MATVGHQVHKAAFEEADTLARTLARAFYDDPIFRWMLPDDARRLTINERFFSLGLRKLWLRHDETYAAVDGVGAAVWHPPKTWKLSPRDQIRLTPAFVHAFGRRLPRVMSVLSVLEKHHPREAHYYLLFAGVDPEHQGRGYGSALLRPVLDRCDAGGMPAYLEASSPRNRALYERHGFEVMEELRVGRGSPPLWPMWRTPA